MSNEQPERPRATIPLGERPRRRPGFLGRRNLMDYEAEGVYLEKKTRSLPPWLLPLLIFALVLLALFWILPRQLERARRAAAAPLPGEQARSLNQIGDDLAVVTVTAADLLDQPSIGGRRVTQALYNEAVTLLASDSANYLRVRLADGTTGYVARDQLSAETSSLLLRAGMFKVIVREPLKRIMSHAASGTLLAEAPMGSVLYADYESDQVMRLNLPGGGQGWISRDGVFVLPAEEELTQPDNFIQTFTSSAMAFLNVRWVPGGQTQSGISPEGIARLAAFLNGLTLPHTLEDLALVGSEVNLPLDSESGLPDLRYLREGDLVFFYQSDDPDRLESLAICMPERQWLKTEANRSFIRLSTIADQTELGSRIKTVRRLAEP